MLTEINNMNNFETQIRNMRNKFSNLYKKPGPYPSGPMLISGNNQCLTFEFKLSSEDLNTFVWGNSKLTYVLKIKKIESSSSLLFTCQKEDDVTLLYDYSSLLSLKELRQMNKNFNNCDNIDRIINSIKNIFIKYNNVARPRVEFSRNNEDELILFFRSPLMSGEIEETYIILRKKERDIREQFNKLVKAYEDLKKDYNELSKKYLKK